MMGEKNKQSELDRVQRRLDKAQDRWLRAYREYVYGPKEAFVVVKKVRREVKDARDRR